MRDTWEVPKSRVKIDKRRWHRALGPVLDRFRRDLGVPDGCELTADLHSLLVYGPGQFFVAHQDSEKDDAMVGSLVVTLPSSFTGGDLVAKMFKREGIRHVFTLSGLHVAPIYDGCLTEGIQLVDTRHEQTAAFAAEGWAKVTRRPGVAALTAGPGVTNGVSAITSAHLNGSPVCVIGGRAPHARRGGSAGMGA